MEASSSWSIRRISGDNEFYSIYPNEKEYVHIFHIWIACYTPRDALRPRPVWTYLYSVRMKIFFR